MSRAFVKDSDDDLAAGELPERPLPAHANYVTPHGLEQLQARVRELQEQHERLAPQAAEDSEAKQKLRVVERDLRYFNAQLERAVVVDLHGQPRDEVHFGAAVSIRDEEGKHAPVHDRRRRRSRRRRRQDQLGLAARQGDDRRARRRHRRLAPSGGRDRGRDRRDRLSGPVTCRPVSSDRKNVIRSRAGRSLSSCIDRPPVTGHLVMKFLALLVALLLEQVRPLRKRNRLYQWFGRYAAGLEEKFDGGQYRHGVIAWLLAVGPLRARHAGGLSRALRSRRASRVGLERRRALSHHGLPPVQPLLHRHPEGALQR